ncbi:hypothetical protein Tco_1555038 [Tanacetum coccineum]
MIWPTHEEGQQLCNLLQQNLDIYAWKPANMTGVPRHIAEHRLNIREGCSPVRQKKRGQAADRNQAIQEEVGKLVAAGIMKEVQYHDWLSNPVMVKKHDDSWRIKSDFIAVEAKGHLSCEAANSEFHQPHQWQKKKLSLSTWAGKETKRQIKGKILEINSKRQGGFDIDGNKRRPSEIWIVTRILNDGSREDDITN